MSAAISLDLRAMGSVPLPQQEAFAYDWEHRLCALVGGWGSGKTWSGARKLVSQHIWNAHDDAGGMTGVWSACIAPTMDGALKFCIPALKEALDESGVSWIWVPSQSCFLLPDFFSHKYRRPSKIMVVSAHKASNITGWEVGVAWADEVARWKRSDDPLRDSWIQLQGRVRAPRARVQQINATYTNEGDLTRPYEEFEENPTDQHACYKIRSGDNPAVADAVESLRNGSMTPEMLAQYLDGEAMSLRGNSMYSSFDKRLHIVPDLKPVYHRDVDLHVSFDFNINPGMHVLLGQHDKANDLLTCFAEIHQPRLDLRGSLDILIALLKGLAEKSPGPMPDWPWRELVVFGDATGNTPNITTSLSCYQMIIERLRAAGIPFRLCVPRANPPVVHRVHEFNAALKDIQGGVHYLVHPSCKRLIADLRQMRWGQDGKADKHETALSHASDAEGYRVHQLRPIIPPRIGGGTFGTIH